MPKHEAGTPKAIANRIKAKGLQKLRWYCQMCQKQCRDENGFKCHTMSESHQRQLLLFAENPNRYLGTFSKEFEEGFVELLRRRFGTKRVHANQVYQEYIADRHHLHMNATQWETLTDLVKWLGREGKCKVDQTEKGWFITYIDRDPETIRRQEAIAKKEKMSKDDEEQLLAFINKQVERAKQQSKDSESTSSTELKRESEEEKVTFSLAGKPKPTETVTFKTPFPVGDKAGKSTSKEQTKPEKRKRSALDDIMEEQERTREKTNRKDYWVTEGIVVKVMTKQLGEKYYKKKGVVKMVKDKYQATVQMLDTGDKLKLDQAHLETVIPSEGRLVRVVNGAYRGHNAKLISIQEKEFSCTVQIESGPLHGRVIKHIQYEDICKFQQAQDQS